MIDNLFCSGNFQFIERDSDVMFDVDEVKEKIPILYQKRKRNLLKTQWNKHYKSPPKNVPYIGYQDPDEIDWSQYGPDRPTKRKKKKEYVVSSASFQNSFVATFSFFGLLLPGILGTLFFLGVPIAKVGLGFNLFRIFCLVVCP